ncbi:MAG: BamA/TamA family outer membrane protein [Gemmatimonadales bacterium]
MMRRLGLAAVLLAGLPAAAGAQYFGRNKVQYGRFDFSIIQTEHFDVYYYPEEREAALDIARLAERSYARLSRALSHQFDERKPIIPYASHSDFQQTNTSGEEIDESTGGFTDFLRHRNIFPLTGSYEENEHVLMHEMVHQFQFDIWSRGKGVGGVQGIINANAPLWFGEGMAEYFSIGAVDPNTAMWLRDAALEGKLPSAETFYRIFPYRFGHALVAYIGQRWGDEAIGQITKSAAGVGGVEGALHRVLGLSFDQLVRQWQDAVQKQYLPEIGNRQKGRAIATPLLTEKISDGTYHLAPAFSPDGSRIAFLSERNFFFIDLYLADGNTGKVIRRMLKSSFSGNYETFRFINSSASWSPDGRFLAIAAQRAGKDDIVIVDAERNKQVRAIRLPLAGATNPTWSPDGQRLVFSGLAGGISDLYTVNVDGSDLKRLTNDKAAELHPVWSPDGGTIAFVTDRGPDTDFKTLRWGDFRIALYDLASGRIETPEALGAGRNVSPQWSPDGKSIAFVSTRNGVANVFLWESEGGQVYQLTDFYTGVQGITALSPVLTWARGADRLAFVYFEQAKYDVYSVTNPRSLKRQPWTREGVIAQRPLAQISPTGEAARPAVTPVAPPSGPQILSGGTVYRTPQGFRRADSLPSIPDSVRVAQEPISIARILDSIQFVPPDTSEFTFKPYKVTFEPEYVTRPSIGYTRDNFGRGLTGSASIVLGDMLGNHRLGFAASLNGRLPETLFLAQYVNLSRRLNWAGIVSQEPYFFYEGSGVVAGPRPGEATYITSIRRIVQRQAALVAAYPFSRFRRMEFGLSYVNVDDDRQELLEFFDPLSGALTQEPQIQTTSLQSANFASPSLALVYDNTIFGSVGPWMGRRSRFEVAPRVGTWTFTTLTADYRRYDRFAGPFVFATRLFYYGHHGRDETRFRFYGGYPDILRGYTSGSFGRNECLTVLDPNTFTGCEEADQLVGTRLAVFNAELRFPLLYAALGFLPVGFPSIEGALFFDAGMVWEGGIDVSFSRKAGESLVDVRSPLKSYGVGLRANILNLLILRLDYARPLDRSGLKHLWTLSLGPTF